VATILSRRKIFLGGLIVAVLGIGVIWAMDLFWPFGPSYLRQPKLAEPPPLMPHARTSLVTVPVTVALPAIRATLDAELPRSFTGKRENPMSGPFGKTDINWTIGRGALSLAGQPEGLMLSTKLTGTLRITDHARRADAGNVNIELERWLQDVTGGLDHRGDVRGSATLTVQPALLPNWRIEPKLAGRVTIAEGGLNVAGFAIEVSDDVKAAIDRTVSDQLKTMQARLRDDPQIEQAARREWSRLCRSISLAGLSAGNPNMFLELRPIRAFASQPMIDASAMALTMGVEAETRIVFSATKPNCPFPARLEIVPPADQGRLAATTPIDIPFTEINRLLNAQLRGKTFPENSDAAGQITVRRARIYPSGDRLLIAMLVTAREKKTWFGFNAEATVFISARPQLDRNEQVLRLTDLLLDVESRAAFGFFGAAARAALPYFEESVRQNAVIDLKPYLASARTGIEAVIAEFDKQDDGISTAAAVTELRLAGIEFDSKTLRVVAEVEGNAKVAVSKLPAP
jgi:hypothetical protein